MENTVTAKLENIQKAIDELKEGVEEITVEATVDLTPMVDELKTVEAKLDLIVQALNGGE